MTQTPDTIDYPDYLTLVASAGPYALDFGFALLSPLQVVECETAGLLCEYVDDGDDGVCGVYAVRTPACDALGDPDWLGPTEQAAFSARGMHTVRPCRAYTAEED